MEIKLANQLLKLYYKRRSIRKFDGEMVIPGAIEKLKQSALLAPSAKNIKPWEFIFVENKKLIEGLSKSKDGGSAFLKGAPLAIVVTGDTDKSDMWIEDCSIAATYMMLEAEAMDLGCCWIQIRGRSIDGSSSEDYVRELLDIDDNMGVLNILAVGWPGETKDGYQKEELRREKIKNITYE